MEGYRGSDECALPRATGAGGIAEIRNVRGGQAGKTLTGNGLGNILIGERP
jgi:hypothetical protein